MSRRGAFYFELISVEWPAALDYPEEETASVLRLDSDRALREAARSSKNLEATERNLKRFASIF